jgi:PTS system nitrogen regulatory IIA component
MQLTIQDVARLFTVSEKTIHQWLDSKSLPGFQVNGDYRFNRAEVINWAMANQINVSTDIFSDPESVGIKLDNLGDSIKTGGIYYKVKVNDKTAALKSIVELMNLPAEVDKEFLFNVLLAREELASTGIGDGIAIPHVRNPLLLHIPKPIVSLCFLEEPIDFNSIDRKPVFCLFTIVSPSIRAHLHLLSRLSFALRDEKLKNAIQAQAPREEILSHIERIENELDKLS